MCPAPRARAPWAARRWRRSREPAARSPGCRTAAGRHGRLPVRRVRAGREPPALRCLHAETACVWQMLAFPVRAAYRATPPLMKVSAFTFCRDAVRFDYPVVESIRSLLPLVDE